MSDEAAVTTDADKAKAAAEAEKTAHAARMKVLTDIVQAKFDDKVTVKPTLFRFKTIKEIDKDGKETGVETKRPNLEIPVPTLSVNGIIHLLETGADENGQPNKALQLVLESLEDTVLSRAKEIIGNDEKWELNADNFPYEELSWEKIANLPKAERRGPGIAAEVWESFGKDYGAVMPAATGKKQEQIANHVKIYMAKFNPVKTNKKVLSLLKDQLGIYVNTSPNAETYQECVEFLTTKIDNLMKFDEASVLENL